MVGELENERLPDALRLIDDDGLAVGDTDAVEDFDLDNELLALLDGRFEGDGGVDGDDERDR